MGAIVIVLSALGGLAIVIDAMSDETVCETLPFTEERVCTDVDASLRGVKVVTGLGLAIYGALLGAFMLVFAAMAENVAAIASSNIHLAQLLASSQSARIDPSDAHDVAFTRECPSCKEAMLREAQVCPHCQRESTPWKFHDNVWWAKDAEGRWTYLDAQTQEWKNPELQEDA